MNVRVNVLFAVRDARGLCAEEKAILHAIELRGEARAGWERLAEDAGLKKKRFYKYRGDLLTKGLIDARRRAGATTIYRVNEDVLALYVPDSTPPQNGEVPKTGSSQNGERPFPKTGKQHSPKWGMEGDRKGDP